MLTLNHLNLDLIGKKQNKNKTKQTLCRRSLCKPQHFQPEEHLDRHVGRAALWGLEAPDQPQVPHWLLSLHLEENPPRKRISSAVSLEPRWSCGESRDWLPRDQLSHLYPALHSHRKHTLCHRCVHSCTHSYTHHMHTHTHTGIHTNCS